MGCLGCGDTVAPLTPSGYCARCAVIKPVGFAPVVKRRSSSGGSTPPAKRAPPLLPDKPGPAPLKPFAVPQFPPVRQDKHGSVPRQAHIHPEDLRVALFNIQDLGGGPARSATRSADEIEKIARVIAEAEAGIVIILEVKLAPGAHFSPVQRIVKKIELYLMNKDNGRFSRHSKLDVRQLRLDDNIEKEIQLFFKNNGDMVKPLLAADVIDDVIKRDGKRAIAALKPYLGVTTKKASSAVPDGPVSKASGLAEIEKINTVLIRWGYDYTYSVVHKDAGGELVLALYRRSIIKTCTHEFVEKKSFHGRCPILFRFELLKKRAVINVIGWHAPFTDVSAREHGYAQLKRFIDIFSVSHPSESLLIVGDFNTQKDEHFAAIEKMKARGADVASPAKGIGTTVSLMAKSMAVGGPKTHVRNHYDHCFLAHVGMPKVFIADYETVSPIVDGVAVSDHCLIVVSLRDGDQSLEEPVLPSSGRKPGLDRASSEPFGPYTK